MKVRRTRGLASGHLCVRCIEDGISKQAQDWALVHGETGMDPWADYVPLCRSCHKKYDLRGVVRSDVYRENIAAARRGKHHSAETRAKISRSLQGNTNRGKR